MAAPAYCWAESTKPRRLLRRAAELGSGRCRLSPPSRDLVRGSRHEKEAEATARESLARCERELAPKPDRAPAAFRRRRAGVPGRARASPGLGQARSQSSWKTTRLFTMLHAPIQSSDCTTRRSTCSSERCLEPPLIESPGCARTTTSRRCAASALRRVASADRSPTLERRARFPVSQRNVADAGRPRGALWVTAQPASSWARSRCGRKCRLRAAELARTMSASSR